MILWRISNHLSLAGDGGLRAPGRWHNRGRRVVYCSESPAVALLEILVHFELTVGDLPARYRLLKLQAPDDLVVTDLPVADLPTDWVRRADLTRVLGDGWLDADRSALLRVPSAVVPETFNLLINPRHQDGGRITVARVSEHPIDPRLLE